MARTPDHDFELSERLLGGAIAPDSAPAGLERVVALFDEARTTPAASAAPAGLVAEMTALATSAPAVLAPRRKPMLAKFLSAKVAAAAFGAVAFSATGAAAATGNLPDAAQDRVASVAKNVGVTLPTSASSTAHNVRAVLDDETLTGREKGKAVSDAARGDHGPDDADESGDANAEKGRATADAKKAGAADAGAANSDTGRDNAPSDAPSDTPAPVDTPAGPETGAEASGDAAGFGTGTAADGADNADAADDAPVNDDTPAGSRPAGRP